MHILTIVHKRVAIQRNVLDRTQLRSIVLRWIAMLLSCDPVLYAESQACFRAIHLEMMDRRYSRRWITHPINHTDYSQLITNLWYYENMKNRYLHQDSNGGGAIS